MKILKVVFVFLLITNCRILFSIPEQLKFNFITIDDGLSNNNILSITQDKRGFIWFATDKGINRYDGYRIVWYNHHPPDSNSLASDLAQIVFTDSRGDLWIGTEGGLDVYNYEQDNFIRQQPAGQLSETFGIVEDIIEDAQGTLWMGTSKGLFYYHSTSKEWKKFNPPPGGKSKLLSEHIYRLMADSKGNIWISFYKYGICVYNLENQSLKYYESVPGDDKSLSDSRIERLYEDHLGNIWIGTLNKGLSLFNPRSNNFSRIIIDENEKYSQRVRVILEDNRNNLLIGTRGGLYVYDSGNKKFIRYAHTAHEISILTYNSILCSFIDRTGVLWLGTFSGGVNYSDTYQKEFRHYRAKPNDPHFLSNPNVHGITEDGDKNIWIGTAEGLNMLNRNTNTFEYYFNNPANKNSLSHNDVKCLAPDEKGNLWIGTNNGGLDYLDPRLKLFTHFKHDSTDQNSITSDKIYGLLYDSKKVLWVLSNSNIDNQFSNIDIVLPGNRKFTHLKEKAFFGITEDHSGDIWIGSIGGFWHYKRSDSTFKWIKSGTFIGKVYTIKEDSRHNIWIGHDKGLSRYRADKNTLLHYNEENGYPFDFVYGILEDRRHNLWISTNNGLVKFTDTGKGNNTYTFRVYGNKDGLQSRQFNYNAFYHSKNDEMFFGGINGMNTFFPENIRDNPYKAEIVFTQLKINNKVVPIHADFFGVTPLKKSISETRTIRLSYKTQLISVEFSAMHYAMPENNSFMYKLEGLDDEWHDIGFRNEVTLAKLTPGKYNLFVKASNNDGYWNEEGISVVLIITPPWWKALVFRIFFVFITLGLLLGFYFYRITLFNKQKEHLEQLVYDRTKEIEEINAELMLQAEELNENNAVMEERQQYIEEQAEELQMKNEHLQDAIEQSLTKQEMIIMQTEKLEETNRKLTVINATKDKLFSIIAHDLKNPFSSILSFSDILRTKFQHLTEEKKLKFINVIYDSSHRVFDLLENLLQWARTQTDNIQYQPEAFNLCEVIDANFDLVKDMLEEKEITLTKNSTDNTNVFADRNMINTVIRNLLGNAIKYTEKGAISVVVTRNGAFAEVNVTDSGIGISEAKMNTIFEIEQEKSTSGTRNEKGSGLGLLICKDFIQINGGEITVKSVVGQGTTFTFSVPLKP